jgi:DNA primase
LERDIIEFLRKVGREPEMIGGEEVAIFCPFHDNQDTPALWINKKTGLWHCFNPTCGKRGSFRTFVKLLTGEGEWGLKRDVSFEELDEMFKEQKDPSRELEMILEMITIDYNNPEDVKKLDYMVERGFDLSTLEYFEVAYSSNKNRVTIPVRDEHYQLVGFIGRTTVDDSPKYLYTKGFKRGKILFNLNNAKHHNKVIVVEGSLDVLKLHQSGFPNTVSTLGAQVTEPQIELLKEFDEIVIFPDGDSAGKGPVSAIMEGCPRKEISIVDTPEGTDAGDLSAEEIRKLLSNKINAINYIYNSL